MELQELYSKWELNERTGDRFRTVSLHTANYNQVFAIEKLSCGHRRVFTAPMPEFSGAQAEYKHLSDATEKAKLHAARVTYGEQEAIHNKALL
jgi:hypothetical protein